MESAEASTLATRWWPDYRPIDGVGVGLIAAFALWVWWASRAEGGAAGPLIALLLTLAVVAALARWATYFHGSAAAVLVIVALLVFAIATGGDEPRGLGPDASPEAAGALLAVGTGAAAMAALRAGHIWPRSLFGIVTLGFAVLTSQTGSVPATLLAVLIVVATLALAAMPMRERRWVIVWPGAAAVSLLVGTLAIAAVPVPDFGWPDRSRVERWRTALDAVTGSPVYGIGRGNVPPEFADAGNAWVSHEPLQVAADTGLIGLILLIALLWWALAWVARLGGGPGTVIAGVVIAGSVAHACIQPIWHVPAVPLAIAAVAGAGSMRGGEAGWRLGTLRSRFGELGDRRADDEQRDAGRADDEQRDASRAADTAEPGDRDLTAT